MLDISSSLEVPDTIQLSRTCDIRPFRSGRVRMISMSEDLVGYHDSSQSDD